MSSYIILYHIEAYHILSYHLHHIKKNIFHVKKAYTIVIQHNPSPEDIYHVHTAYTMFQYHISCLKSSQGISIFSRPNSIFGGPHKRFFEALFLQALARKSERPPPSHLPALEASASPPASLAPALRLPPPAFPPGSGPK